MPKHATNLKVQSRDPIARALPTLHHDDYCRAPVSSSSFRPWWYFLTIELGAMISIPVFFIGGQLGFTLTVLDLVLATLIGGLVLGAIGALTGRLGAITRCYWFSTESLNIQEAAKIIGDVIQLPPHTPLLGPDEVLQGMQMLGITDVYFTKGAVEFLRQVLDGRMAYVGDVRDDFPKLLGRTGTTLKDWAALHKDDLLERYQLPVGSKV